MTDRLRRIRRYADTPRLRGLTPMAHGRRSDQAEAADQASACILRPSDISFRCIESIHRLDTQPGDGCPDSSPDRVTSAGSVSIAASNRATRQLSRREARADMSQRTGVLELAVLGLLHETPMHGYELRKRLNSVLGAFRAFGYGSLYPCLKDLTSRGLIAEDTLPDPAKPLAGRRSKIVYRLTAEGKERLQDLLGQAGPASWEDDGFGVRFAFFGLTRADVRLRILEGR